MNKLNVKSIMHIKWKLKNIKHAKQILNVFWKQNNRNLLQIVSVKTSSETSRSVLLLHLKHSDDKYNWYYIFNKIVVEKDELINNVQNKHSDACIYLPPYKLDVLKITYFNKVL